MSEGKEKIKIRIQHSKKDNKKHDKRICPC